MAEGGYGRLGGAHYPVSSEDLAYRKEVEFQSWLCLEVLVDRDKRRREVWSIVPAEIRRWLNAGSMQRAIIEGVGAFLFCGTMKRANQGLTMFNYGAYMNGDKEK